MGWLDDENVTSTSECGRRNILEVAAEVGGPDLERRTRRRMGELLSFPAIHALLHIYSLLFVVASKEKAYITFNVVFFNAENGSRYPGFNSLTGTPRIKVST